MLFGDDVEGQLAPFEGSKWDQWWIGGRWSPYFKLTDVASEAFRARLTRQRIAMSPEVANNKHEEAITLQDLGIGGPGAFGYDDVSMQKLASGCWVDQAIKKNIDFEGMMDTNEEEARAKYAEFEIITRDIDPPLCSFEQFLIQNGLPKYSDEVATEEQKGLLNALKQEYSVHPWIMALWDNGLGPLLSCPLDYWKVRQGGKEAFVLEARNGSIYTFAVLDHGEWLERGKLGSWGIARDREEEEDWRCLFDEKISACPMDELITAVDCHSDKGG
jgi:hypothetical protein